MVYLDIAVEEWLRGSVEKLAENSGRTISSIARDLIFIGISIENLGGLTTTGPLGVKRKLAKMRFPGKETHIALKMEQELADELHQVFHMKTREAFRTALRLGLFYIKPGDEKIVGPYFEIIRPFAETKAPKIKDERGIKAFQRLESIPL